MKMPFETSISQEETDKEQNGYILYPGRGYVHFNITKDGFIRCMNGENKYGIDCTFRRFETLCGFARHCEKHHWKRMEE